MAYYESHVGISEAQWLVACESIIHELLELGLHLFFRNSTRLMSGREDPYLTTTRERYLFLIPLALPRTHPYSFVCPVFIHPSGHVAFSPSGCLRSQQLGVLPKNIPAPHRQSENSYIVYTWSVHTCIPASAHSKHTSSAISGVRVSSGVNAATLSFAFCKPSVSSPLSSTPSVPSVSIRV